MSKNLVIVESPAKSKTIEKYLGSDFAVLASYGHVRDLIPKEGAVDTDNGFAMRYEVIERNEKHVNAISKAMKKADTLYLATDPDREGEAISWHLYELLRERGQLEGKQVKRIAFNQITKNAVREAVDNPRELSNPMVNAQQARRALDYLVGFNLSPLLWRKIRRGLSAGRVQSPALRMIVERELEIEAFVPQEYWSIEAETEKSAKTIRARLTEYGGEKVEQFTVTNAEQAAQVEANLRAAANGELVVAKVEKKERKRNPAAPFTTSTLQQEASRKLRFSAVRTMRVAQQLYEGVDIGGETVGLISYMRTDSVSLAAEAVVELRQVISERYGTDQIPDQPRAFSNKSKNAQEAHEAVRPTSAARTPEQMKSHLDKDQLALYDLIWKRTVACQMVHALYHTVGVNFACGDGNTFRATGSTLVKPGFLAVYQEGRDDAPDDDEDRILPPLAEGDKVPLNEVITDQHFTEPPPRYSEASLVRSLEEHGIGRPSTYASILSTLQQREYVEQENRRFTPTDIGRVVNRFLTEHFEKYVDYDFTARLEDDLDAVSRGEREWEPLMQQFWGDFKKTCDEKADISRDEAAQARELGIDPKSGKPVSVRIGRYGPFVQIGTRDDEDKPKFAGLRPGQKMDTIQFEEAMELFKLPRKLGETPEGEPVSANIGRFGPYVRYANKFVSIKKPKDGEEGDDPYTITLERALELITAKKIEDANKLILSFEGTDIQVLRGRWGPYITDGNKNAKIPKDKEAETLTQAECEELLAQAPERKRGGRKKAATKKAATKKAATKKAATKKAASKKAAPKKKAATKKAAPKKAAAKKAAPKKAAAKKAVTKKVVAKEE